MCHYGRMRCGADGWHMHAMLSISSVCLELIVLLPKVSVGQDSRKGCSPNELKAP